MEKKKISVIMSVFNEVEDQLIDSISSILKQSFKDFEFIIVLDNPNNTIARNIILKNKKNDSRVVFLENEKNM
jgi:glycosyltransferase involved in cell wall biosynthesis